MRDLRRYSRDTNIRLAIGFVLVLFFIGDGLIYFIYGQPAAISGLLCILGGLAQIALIALVLFLIGHVVKKIDR